MDRYVMRHPDTGGVALIPESSMPLHKGQGWLRVSDAIAEEVMHSIDPAVYADAPDLDAPPEPVTELATAPPAKTTKEK